MIYNEGHPRLRRNGRRKENEKGVRFHMRYLYDGEEHRENVAMKHHGNINGTDHTA